MVLQKCAFPKGKVGNASFTTNRILYAARMKPPYRLHYAPDNASLVVRLALEELAQPYETVLVDRRVQEQRSPAYRALNPCGLIPVLETPDGAMFETAAILLWLADRHDALAPAPDSPERATFLKWLFFASNTLHADLRMLFYPEQYLCEPSAHDVLRDSLKARLARHLTSLNDIGQTFWLGAETPSILDIYLACQLRWMALYPTAQNRSWFRLANYPFLESLCARLETRASVARACEAEGLGQTPFIAPTHPNPPEGSAT